LIEIEDRLDVDISLEKGFLELTPSCEDQFSLGKFLPSDGFYVATAGDPSEAFFLPNGGSLKILPGYAYDIIIALAFKTDRGVVIGKCRYFSYNRKEAALGFSHLLRTNPQLRPIEIHGQLTEIEIIPDFNDAALWFMGGLEGSHKFVCDEIKVHFSANNYDYNYAEIIQPGEEVVVPENIKFYKVSANSRFMDWKNSRVIISSPSEISMEGWF
jgi:hypothetical protein